MARRAPRRGRLIPVLFFTFAAGVAVGWLLRDPMTRDRLSRPSDVMLTTGTGGTTPPSASPVDSVDTNGLPPAASATTRGPAATVAGGDPIDLLRAKDLRLPIDNADVKAMEGQFGDPRDGGARGHEAVDILAPRGTPIHAVEGGTIAKLFRSKLGGITLYQFDPSGRFCYYYAHLDRYADGLREGQEVSRGDVLGYVGTSGNAPANTPHLHFAIFALTPERHWWEGTPLDPWAAFRR
jgi:murein DD-endopeptidase MepM/ murein hydrolase activator NlpD